MTRTAIVTDSTADLPRDLLDEHSITAVPLTVTIGARSFLDGVEITPDDFYSMAAASPDFPTTSQPSPALFAEAYERLLRDHDEVLSIHISSRLSGTLASAEQAVAMVASDRVKVVDSELVSMPLGLLVLAAASLAASGAGVAEVISRCEPVRRAATAYFTVASLESLRRGGRIGRASAMIGSVLQVKPVLRLDGGQVTPVERVRTYDRAVARVLELTRLAGGGGQICAIVGHASQPDVAERLVRELEPVADTLLVQPLGPVVGAHAGAGTVGIGVYPAALMPLGMRRLAGARSR